MTDPHAEVQPRVWFVVVERSEIRCYVTHADGRDYLHVIDFRRPPGEMMTVRCVDE